MIFLDGVLAQAEFVRDFAVAESVRYQRNHLFSPRCVHSLFH